MKCRTPWLLVLQGFLLAGCARVPLAPPQPSMANLEVLQAVTIAPVNVGQFVLADGKPAEMDKVLSVRGNAVYSPIDDSFAQFLKESLVTELRTAGKYDPAAPTVVRGWLTENRMEAGGMEGNRAFLGARFAVNHGEQVVYDKELAAQARWDADFAGVSAVPAAINEYTMLFRKLLGQLFADEDFRKATQPARKP